MNLSNNVASLVLEEKVHEYIISDGKLYCSVNGTLNDYIGYINLSSSSTSVNKLTNYAGEFLRISNGYLYYNLNDLITVIDSSKHGIWKINLSTKAQTHVLALSDVNGFDIDSNSTIYYTNTLDLHLYSYNQNNKVTTDLLENFVIPETTPLNTGGRNVAYGNKIYYLNNYKNKTLYCYNETTKTNTQLTDNKVADFTISGDTLYFNLVTMFTNNDMYSVNLKTGSTATKINSNDMRNMVVEDDYIYGTHYNFWGVSGGIYRMKLDGSEYIKFCEINGANNLTVKDDNLYFINCTTGQDNGNIEYISLSSITSTSVDLEATNLSKNIKNVKQFLFENDDIFYMYNGTIDNSIRKTSFNDLNNEVKIASSKTNPNEMISYKDNIIYYSYPMTSVSSAGFYKVSKSATKDGTQTRILDYSSNKYYGSDFAISNSGYLYFLNYIPKLVLGNAHTYQMSLSTYNVNQID